ncbi:MAG: alpha,alpha-trehalose-phosphate synthase (UDP-forming), partial [Chloroflexota bacterium]
QQGLSAMLGRAWRDGYQPVNRAFADALAREIRQGDSAPLVMLHDYHLYLTAELLRERIPAAIVQQFIHIPWPEPQAWQALPSALVRAICRGLLANDIVGFQTKRSTANFVATCEAKLPEVTVDRSCGLIRLGGHPTLARAYPISIDVASLRTFASSPEVAAYERRIRPLCGQQTVLRVDRLDPSKNVLTGYLAYERMLEMRPDLRRRVNFLSFLVPSRTSIPEYQRYGEKVFAAVRRINSRFAQDGWQPIHLFYENNYPQAIAAMRLYDVLMVNSALDGMNLVSKEGPIVNKREGVLVLSRGAGSFEELGGDAIGISPFDVEGTSQALQKALAMPFAERQRRAAALRRIVESRDIKAWIYAQMEDILDLSARSPVLGVKEADLSRTA